MDNYDGVMICATQRVAHIWMFILYGFITSRYTSTIIYVRNFCFETKTDPLNQSNFYC